MYKIEDIKEYTDTVINEFPHMYRIDRESNNYFLLELYLAEIKQINNNLYELLNSLDIKTAVGSNLNRFGDNFDLSRNTNETDNEYRLRILSELSKKSKNATFETILSVLKLSIEDFEKNVFIYEEGIRKTIEPMQDRIKLNVYSGAYNDYNNEVYFEEKGGTIYIVLNKKLSKKTKDAIKNILLEIRAKGVEITIDFKYKLQEASYICNGAFTGMKRILKITDSFYDSIMQEKALESGISRINVITKEGVK